jgi:hypothetical protein
MAWYKHVESNSPFLELVKANTPFAFFLAASVTLKTNISIYIAMFFFINLFLGLMFISRRRDFFLAYTATGFLTVIILAPWLGSFMDQLIIVSRDFMEHGSQSNPALAITKGYIGSFVLFNNLELFWGPRLFWYLVFSLLMGSLILIALLLFWRERRLPKPTVWAAPLIAVCLTTFLYYFLSPVAFPWSYTIQHSVRYATPIVLPAVPLVPLIIYSISCATTSKLFVKPTLLPTFVKETLAPYFQGLSILFVGMFLVLFVDRLERMADYNHIISFGSKSSQENFSNDVMTLNSTERKKEIMTIQEKIPEGEKILVWIGMPIHLNFSRNRIETVYGFFYPWNNTPDTDIEVSIQSLKDRGIRYVLWQFEGYPMQDVSGFRGMYESGNLTHQVEGRYGLHFIRALTALWERSEQIYLNNKTKLVLFKVE